MLKQLSFVFILSLCAFFVNAAVPDIINFNPKQYNAHSINYCFAQDSNGVMYIGNAYGILEYDGQTWRKIGLVDGKSALSLSIDAKGKIYVGSSSEFGYLQKNKKGLNEYISLKSKLPKKEISEILDIVCHQGAVYFRTLHHVFCYQQDRVIELNQFDKNRLTYYLGKEKTGVKAFQQGVGTLNITGVEYSVAQEVDRYESITDVLTFESGKIFIGKHKIIDPNNHNIFKRFNTTLQEVEITSALKINEQEFIIGTSNKGIFQLNTSGEILSKFDLENGLQDNFIHDLFLDNFGNLWLAYNNGIGVIKWTSPIRYITRSIGIEGMGYCGAVHQGNLYLGTSQGLFLLPNWKKKLRQQTKFKRVRGIEGTINDLKVHNGQLLACQAAEVFEIQGTNAHRISTGAWWGAWTWKPDPSNKNRAFVGTYLGISVYEFEQNHWVYKKHIKGFEESSRVFEIDQRGILWVVQGNKGLYRVKLNSSLDSAVSVTNYTETTERPSKDFFNDIFSLNDSIIVSSYGGTYCLNKDSLIPLSTFDQLGKMTFRMRKFNEKGVYSIFEDRAHILKNSNGKWKVQNTPVSFLQSYLVGSAEFFSEITPGFFLIGTQDGFASYSPATDTDHPDSVACLIRKIELLNARGDSTLFHDNPSLFPSLPFENNNIRITYSLPLFGENDHIKYETQLFKNGNSMHHWQQVHSVKFKEYTNLKEGKYTFWVRAKKGNQTMGQTSLVFSILPPWYRTSTAYFIYGVLGLIGIIVILKLFKNQKIKLELENKKELAIKEKLHHAEKLELALKNKENELAYIALTYTQKKDLLANLTAQLNKISKDLSHEHQIKFRSVKKAITNNLDDESNWENFRVHFDEKNDNFFRKLKEKEKRMSESYLLFCSYVRMGKSNKEIAELLNISVAAVEKRKYRLKKKWDLPDDTSFTEYLRNL